MLGSDILKVPPMANGTVNGAPGETRRPWITILVILLVIFLAVGAYVELRPHRIRISVVKPMRQNVSSAITTNGKVNRSMALSPMHRWRTVEKILVTEGARVRQDQLLLVLDDRAPAATWPRPRRG